MSYKKKRIFGLLISSIGFGVLLTITMPIIGWIFLSAVSLIIAGIYLYKC